VQIDPIKPKLKPPGNKRLKLNSDVQLSHSAFKFHLRRYTLAPATLLVLRKWAYDAALRAIETAAADDVTAFLRSTVGRCRLTPSNPC
jgi:hypothetical protein